MFNRFNDVQILKLFKCHTHFISDAIALQPLFLKFIQTDDEDQMDEDLDRVEIESTVNKTTREICDQNAATKIVEGKHVQHITYSQVHSGFLSVKALLRSKMDFFVLFVFRIYKCILFTVPSFKSKFVQEVWLF